MFINQQGEQEASRSIVVVTEELKVGDYLFFGTSVEANPDNVESAYQIKQYESVPDKQGKSFLRRCRL